MHQRSIALAALALAASVAAAASCSLPEGPKKAAIVPGPGVDAPVAEEGDGEGRARPPRKERDEEAPDSCMAPGPIDASVFPYKKAGVVKGACTADEAAALSAYFKAHANDDDFSVDAWQKEVGPGCARCAFSDGSGPTWTPIIVKDGDIDAVDRGGCIEVLSGSEACGRAYQQVTDCSNAACLPVSEGGESTCEGQKDFVDCLYDRKAIFAGPCEDAYEAAVAACGDDLSSYEEQCQGRYTFEGPLAVMCVDGGDG